MKPALNQQATRTTNGTQNWTDASITSDQTLQLFVGTEATANDTTTAAEKLFIGATDLTNNICQATSTLDAAVASSTFSSCQISSTKSLMRTTSGGSENVAAAVSATLSNGLTMNYTATDAGAYLFNGLSLAGTDHVTALSNVAFTSTDTSKVITHGAGGTPDAIIFIISIGSTGTDNAGIPQKTIISIWDGTNSASVSSNCSTQVSPTLLAARANSAVGNSELGHLIDNSGTDVASFSISSVGATTFTFNRSASGSIAMFVTCISIRHLTGTWDFRTGVTTLPTSTGNSALITGMSVQPQVLIVVPTRLTSTALAANSDAAGSLGFGIACNNNGTTQQMACATTVKNAVSTTVAKCYTSASQALISLDNTGATVNKATVSSWNSDGVTLNHSQVGASAFEVMYFAFGVASLQAPPSSGGIFVCP